jgi:hypothetical protein
MLGWGSGGSSAVDRPRLGLGEAALSCCKEVAWGVGCRQVGWTCDNWKFVFRFFEDSADLCFFLCEINRSVVVVRPSLLADGPPSFPSVKVAFKGLGVYSLDSIGIRDQG